jgi:hypothetical protein
MLHIFDGLTHYLRNPKARDIKEVPTITFKKEQNRTQKTLYKRRENEKERKNK